MARAKRTDRAEARRRHRAQLAAEAAAAAEAAPDDEIAEASTADATDRAPAGRPTSASTDRPRPGGSIRNAFRLAFRPLNLREDLAQLPRLLLNKAFWLPLAIAAAIAVVIVAFQGREIISGILAQYFLGPAPMGSVFLAGFLAPRASYLIGALVGLIVGLLTIAAGLAIVPATDPSAILQVLLLAPLNGAFFAAAAAWYRRFLYLASPARQAPPRRPAAAAARGKPARGR